MELQECHDLMNIIFLMGAAGWFAAAGLAYATMHYRRQCKFLEGSVMRLKKRLSVRWGKWGQEPNWDEITEEDRPSPGPR